MQLSLIATVHFNSITIPGIGIKKALNYHSWNWHKEGTQEKLGE